MTRKVPIGLFLCGIASGSLALADCPDTMPSQLLQDCIVYEGAGSTFPTKDYAHMDLYNEWLRKQQTTEEARQAEFSAMEKK
jgi:hypothetical protein